MPLPIGGKDYRWPPDDTANTYGKYEEHSAWYGGDVQKLASVYVGMGAPGSKPQGMVNVVRSWFWGKQAIAPAPRIRIHVPVAADVSSVSSDLLFSDAPQFMVKDEEANEKVQDRLDEIVEQESFVRSLFEAGEVASALGGVYLRMTWDDDVAPDRPLLTIQHPDTAVPDFRFGRLVGVTFWHIVHEGDGLTYRHLERVEPGVVYHGLYRGTKDKLGDRVSLATLPETADYADLVDENSAIPTEITRMTAVYVPNMLPNRLNRGSSLGRSDYSGVEGLMDAVDESATSWMRDMRLGRGRIIVPAEFLKTMPIGTNGSGRGQGGWFDVDQEVFTPLEGMNPATESSITISQFAIRTKEHQDTIMAFIERIVATAGYSASTFGLMGDVQAQTATEIESRERRSFITRNKKTEYWAPALRDILMAALEFDQVKFNGPGVAPLVVKFGEPVREDMAKRATAIELIARAGAASIARLVKMSDDSLTDEQVKAEVEAIQARQSRPHPALTKCLRGPTSRPDCQSRP